uniref:Uncharacterized protein n=1 Tax=Dendroctonus ponderosae TaxID=77166 RepID=A0AAR5QB94_DENPD
MVLLKNAVLLLVLLCESCNSEHNFMITSGWYKAKKKSDKVVIKKAHSLGPDVIPRASTYIRIGGTVPVLPSGAIHDLVHLIDLKITSAVIEKVHAGAFQNLPKLSKLNLQDNIIQDIPFGVFNKLNISVLFLNKNEISTIDRDAFDDMPNLTKIKLNSNKLSTWSSEWFKRTPRLGTILVRRNAIEEVHKYAFKNLATNEIKALNIYLSKNLIRTIHPQAFSGIAKWGDVFLDRNQLTQLEGDIFENVQSIRKLNLSRNNISGISDNLFKTVRSVEMLDLTANHRLECVPVIVAKQVQKLQLENIRKLTCACVSDLSNITKLLGTEKC